MIDLPFPPSSLNPNKRLHWAAKAKAFKSYKFQCFAILSQHRDELRGRAVFSLEFCPPDARRRDVDNATAAFKAGIDALSEVAGVDDSKFCFTIRKGAPRKGGAVIIA